MKFYFTIKSRTYLGLKCASHIVGMLIFLRLYFTCTERVLLQINIHTKIHILGTLCFKKEKNDTMKHIVGLRFVYNIIQFYSLKLILLHSKRIVKIFICKIWKQQLHLRKSFKMRLHTTNERHTKRIFLIQHAYGHTLSFSIYIWLFTYSVYYVTRLSLALALKFTHAHRRAPDFKLMTLVLFINNSPSFFYTFPAQCKTPQNIMRML